MLVGDVAYAPVRGQFALRNCVPFISPSFPAIPTRGAVVSLLSVSDPWGLSAWIDLPVSNSRPG